VRSERGVIGTWFDKDFDPHGPAGPTAFWKHSDNTTTSDSSDEEDYEYEEIEEEYEEEEEEEEEEEGDGGDEDGPSNGSLEITLVGT
jgi:hypothetical protein